MPKCKRCGGEFEAEELERHEVEGMVYVQCPNCGFTLGDWNSRVHDKNRVQDESSVADESPVQDETQVQDETVQDEN